MLKSISFLFILSLTGASVAFGQTSSTGTKKKNPEVGFYGKRFFMQLGTGFHHNSLLKLASSKERDLRTDPYYSNYKSQIKSDQFNYGFYGSLGVVLKDRVSFALDFNYYFGNIFLKNIGSQNYYDQNGNYYFAIGYDARVKYTTFRIMPRIEIAAHGSNAPVGLVHVLGIGLELSKLKSGDYNSITAYSDQSYVPGGPVIKERNLQLPEEKVFNLTFMYGMEYRLPISKNFAWNFGGYVHLNLPVQILIDESPLGGSSYNGSYYGNDYEREYKLQLSRYRLQNLFSVRTGLVIML